MASRKNKTAKKETEKKAKANGNGYGIASLVLGISSILLPVIGIVTGILAIVFANKQKKIQPSGLATAGMVTGIIGLVFQALALIFVVAIISFIVMFATGAATTVA
jgi:heme/copper-type cytochrome/quinol oxidase subunit 2